MKKIGIIATVTACLFSLTLLSACGGREGEQGEQQAAPESALWGSICYFEDLSGGFVKDGLYTQESRAAVGKTVTYSPEEITGFTFDRENPKNVLSGTVAADGTTTLVAYYVRNVYNISVTGGTSAKESAKFGERVELTPSLSVNGLRWEVEGEGASVEGNSLVVGTSDVSVRAVYQDASLIDGNTYFRAEGSSAQAELKIADPQMETGIVFLYNNGMTQTAAAASESYYAFVAKEGSARLLLVRDGGTDVLSETEVSGYSAGDHVYAISVSEGGAITCSLDGTALFTDVMPEEPITYGGRMGVCSEEEAVSLTALTPLSGEMSVEELRAYALRTMTTLTADVYRFNGKDDIVLEHCEADASEMEDFEEDVRATRDLLESLETVSALITEMDAHGNSLRLRIYKEMVWDSLTSVAQDLSATLMLPFVESYGKEVTRNADGVTISRDVFAPDARWYVPNAYMLYSALEGSSVFGTYALGLLDYLRLELDSASTTAELASINGRYIEDIVRATLWHDFEYYYWLLYNELGSEAVYPIWGRFYNYVAPAGENFTYVGCIEGYLWTGDYRLLSNWFAPDGSSVHDMKTMIAEFIWVRDHQIIVGEEEV